MELGTRVRVNQAAGEGEHGAPELVGLTGVLVAPHPAAQEPYTTAVLLDEPRRDPMNALGIAIGLVTEEELSGNAELATHFREEEVDALD